MRDDAGRRDEAVGHGRPIHVAEAAAASDDNFSRPDVHPGAVYPGKVEHDAVVAGGQTRQAMPTAANRE